MQTLVIASDKGGVGKTTTAVTLASRMASVGSKVLLVDLDSQGHVGAFLGLPPHGDIYEVLVQRREIAKVTRPAAMPGRPRQGLDVLQGNHSTAAAANILLGQPGAHQRLRWALEYVDRVYDWVIIDTPPSLGFMQVVGFVAADWLLMPTTLDFASVVAARMTLEVIDGLRRDVELPLQLVGILPTKWDRRATDSKLYLTWLKDWFINSVWMPIPVDVKAQEAPAHGKTLWEYAPECDALRGRKVKRRRMGGYVSAYFRLYAEIRNEQ